MVTNTPSLEKSYLALVEFLLMSKRQIIAYGSNYGLTTMQAMTLLLLDAPRPMHSLKTVFNCDASNVTGLIDSLEHKKFASRCQSPTDRRIKMVQLEPAGRRARSHLLKHITGPDSFVLSKLSQDEVNDFIRLVEKITA